MKIFVDTQGHQTIARALILIAYEKLSQIYTNHLGFAYPTNIARIQNNSHPDINRYISITTCGNSLDILHYNVINTSHLTQVSLSQAVALIEEEAKTIVLKNTTARATQDGFIIGNNIVLTKEDLKKLNELAAA